MTKRTWILFAVLFVLALVAPLARPMDRAHFNREVTKQAQYFGYGSTGHAGWNYAATLVDLPFLKTVSNETAMAASQWNAQYHQEYDVWVLSDEGLDQLADEQKLPRLTAREKTALQRKAIVHEFVHGWGIDSERITVVMTGLITGKGYKDGSAPKRWMSIIKQRDEEARAKQSAQDRNQSIPPDVLEFLKKLGVTVEQQ